MALLGVASSPAPAALSISNNGRTYVEARAAAMSGDHVRSAQLLASLAQAQPDQVDLARKALSEALGAGQMELALSLASRVPPAKIPTEARLLLAGEEIRRGHPERAIPWLKAAADAGDLSFLAPLVTAWSAADRGNAAEALAALDAIPAGSLLTPLAGEQRGLILLKFKRAVEAESYARQAVGVGGGREKRLRLAFADGFLAAGDRPRALMIIEGMGAGEIAERRRIMAGQPSGQAIDNLPRAFSEVLTAFSADLTRIQRGSPPIGLVQVAHYLNPQSSNTTALLAILLADQDRREEALAVLRGVPANDPLIAEVRDVQARILTDSKRYNEAYQLAAAAVAAPGVESTDYSRLGDVLQAMKRQSQAADAYGQALALAKAQNQQGQAWTLYLLQANALEQANRWPEARAALKQGLLLAPEQPMLLNFLGYAQLERGEELDASEAMIRKASDLAPDDASIADSLGWAEYKRGKLDQAIATLQKAAEKDAGQAEIQEHLGDALFRAGRRHEARFAWNASLVTAEDEIAARVKAKLVAGLTAANAAP